MQSKKSGVQELRTSAPCWSRLRCRRQRGEPDASLRPAASLWCSDPPHHQRAESRKKTVSNTVDTRFKITIKDFISKQDGTNFQLSKHSRRSNLAGSPLPVSVWGGFSEPGVCSALARCLDALQVKRTPLGFARVRVSLISRPPD